MNSALIMSFSIQANDFMKWKKNRKAIYRLIILAEIIFIIAIYIHFNSTEYFQLVYIRPPEENYSIVAVLGKVKNGNGWEIGANLTESIEKERCSKCKFIAKLQVKSPSLEQAHILNGERVGFNYVKIDSKGKDVLDLRIYYPSLGTFFDENLCKRKAAYLQEIIDRNSTASCVLGVRHSRQLKRDTE
ncbi:hypothetical protein BTA51_26200 [Hahella sp. CCB-MM4]|uniref:hypothetical protein n=1 Tax=Hahella sp. (strain CCB-MM4) TaxID=1926491 RepID=UPI000B9BFF78|nr:hypothetical protein [Hahella sp. CCB-MM4]OZG70463.1 hypothetical protein BTA51_26200 [Hahella sp. CCB-MM4]